MPVHLFYTIFFFPLFFSFSILLHASSAVNPQGQALLSWKTSLKGSAEDTLRDWDSSHDTPCKWFGVSCNSNNQVVELNLKYVDLLGNVPTNFNSLGSFKTLVLSGTNLTGLIPKEIGGLQELVHLDLSDNALTGEIPSEICHLPKLEQLLLNSNHLEGSIPDDIGNLSSLIWLILYDNQISGAIPSTLGNLKKLQVIRAGGNKILKVHYHKNSETALTCL